MLSNSLIFLIVLSLPRFVLAETAAEMKPYMEKIPGTDVTFDMVPIPGGKFLLGSPETESGRGKDEGPQSEIEIRPMWVGKFEVTWDEYGIFADKTDIQERQFKKEAPSGTDKIADAVTRPTPHSHHGPIFAKFWKPGFPAMCMTHHAAMEYTRWLSAKTGRNYRLLTEAEWEYACRAGSKTAYGFGDNPKVLGEYATFADNSSKAPNHVGLKKPNAWGLYDMHGNVGEWVLDHYSKNFFSELKGKAAAEPVLLPDEKEYPYVSKGGSWKDAPALLRTAARVESFDSDDDGDDSKGYSVDDPQLPRSIWWHTRTTHIGFRICRPLDELSQLKDFKSPIKSER